MDLALRHGLVLGPPLWPKHTQIPTFITCRDKSRYLGVLEIIIRVLENIVILEIIITMTVETIMPYNII